MKEQKSENKTYTSKSLTPEFKQKYVMLIKGKEHMTHRGLLQLTHAKGIKSINEEIMVYPSQENNYTTFAKATIIDNEGEKWVAEADASPGNCNNMVAPASPRMACTRASGRAMRLFLGIDMVCWEELKSPWEQKPMTMMQKQYMSELMKRKGVGKEQMQALSVSVCHKASAADLTEEDAWDLISYIERLEDTGSASTPSPIANSVPAQPEIPNQAMTEIAATSEAQSSAPVPQIPTTDQVPV